MNINPNTAVQVYAPEAGVWGDEYSTEKVETAAGWQFPSPDEDWMRGYPQEMADFVDAVREEREPLAGALLARETVEVIYAAYVSAEEGRRVAAPMRQLARAVLAGLLAVAPSATAQVGRTVPPPPVEPHFDLGVPGREPFPSDRFTVPDPGQRTGLRVLLPQTNCVAERSPCDDARLLNELDGFDLSPRLAVPFTGPIDPTSVTARSVFLVRLAAGPPEETAGGGPDGRLVVTPRTGPPLEVRVPGRGVDVDGDGKIADVEGLAPLPTGPLAALSLRDGLRQQVVDLMAFVRAVGRGLDVDGDGRPDTRGEPLYYVGQSLGGIYGTLLLAVEPRVRVGVLTVPGGPIAEIARLSPAFRPQLRDTLARRTPPLLNEGAEFREHLPFRRDEPVVAPTPGVPGPGRVAGAAGAPGRLRPLPAGGPAPGAGAPSAC